MTLYIFGELSEINFVEEKAGTGSVDIKSVKTGDNSLGTKLIVQLLESNLNSRNAIIELANSPSFEETLFNKIFAKGVVSSRGVSSGGTSALCNIDPIQIEIKKCKYSGTLPEVPGDNTRGAHKIEPIDQLDITSDDTLVLFWSQEFSSICQGGDANLIDLDAIKKLVELFQASMGINCSKKIDAKGVSGDERVGTSKEVHQQKFGSVLVFLPIQCWPEIDNTILDSILSLADKSYLFTDVSDLRKRSCKISKGISWEETLFSIQSSFLEGGQPELDVFRKFDHRIVRVGLDAVVYSVKEEKIHDTFVYDPLVYEGEIEEQYIGKVYGASEVFCVSILLNALQEKQENLIDNEILTNALVSLRRSHLNGYRKSGGTIEGVDPYVAFDQKYILKKQFHSGAFSVMRPGNGETIQRDNKTLVENRFHKSLYEQDNEAAFSDNTEDKSAESILKLATEIVKHGVGSIESFGLCQARFGGLISVDRNEIQNLRSLYARMVNFIDDGKSFKPLSIAVFGPPGCGKSFAVKQLIKKLESSRPGKISNKLHEINISQLNNASDLSKSLQSARNDVISGKIPVIFLDEFDTPLGTGLWLRYFLAPMQDGQFQDEKASHNLGKVIFVFAGGTAPTFKKFSEETFVDKKTLDGRDSGNGASRNIETNGNYKYTKEQKDEKIPDFVSRLSGFLDISGPNQKNEKGKDNETVPDLTTPLRRAVLLRSLLKIHRPNLFKQDELQIDSDLLELLLNPSVELLHGARSLESVVTMSSLNGKDKFSFSDLPANHLLKLHLSEAFFNSTI